MFKIKNKIVEETNMLEKISAILKEYKGDEDIVITADTTFAELEFDSLDTVELVMQLEDEFDTSIEMDENVKTVGDLMKIIQD